MPRMGAFHYVWREQVIAAPVANGMERMSNRFRLPHLYYTDAQPLPNTPTTCFSIQHPTAVANGMPVSR